MFTLTLQKSRMPQIQGVKGEAVVGYRESSTMLGGQALDNTGDAVSSAFPKGKKHGSFWTLIDAIMCEFLSQLIKARIVL